MNKEQLQKVIDLGEKATFKAMDKIKRILGRDE